MKNFKNFIFIGSNNLSKLLKEITEISTIKVTIYKESSRKTFIIIPHIVCEKQTSGKQIKITLTDNEELSELLNGIEIVSKGKFHRMELTRNLENGMEEYNLNQKEVIILKSPPLCGKMFDFLTETQGLFSNESNNLCATLQRNRFYATDGQTANSMHLLPISQFSRDALVTRRSSYFPKITSSDQDDVGIYPKIFNDEDVYSSHRKSELDENMALEKRISEFQTCLGEFFYDSLSEEFPLLENPKMTKNSKSSPAVVDVHEFSSDGQPRVKKSRVLILSESRFKKLENSFAKFQAKKKIRSLEPLLTEYDNKNEIMDELEHKFVDKFRRMQNTDKKKNVIVMNFELPVRLDDEFLADAKGGKNENRLMNSSNISKTYIDTLKGKKKKNRGNLVVVNDKIFRTSTNTNKGRNKHILGEDNKSLLFLDNFMYKELEKDTMVGILNRKYSTGEKREEESGKNDPVHESLDNNKLDWKTQSVEVVRGYSEIPLDNLIAAVAEKKQKEYAARSRIVWEVYEHYEKILENTKILNPPKENGNGNDMKQKECDLSKASKKGSTVRTPETDLSNEIKSKAVLEKEGEGGGKILEGRRKIELSPSKAEKDTSKSRIPVKVFTSPKVNTNLMVVKNDDRQKKLLQSDETFIKTKQESENVEVKEVTSKNVADENTKGISSNRQKASTKLKSSSGKSLLPRFVNPIKHVLAKNRNETVSKLPESDVNNDNLKEPTEVKKQIEEFIDLKRELNQNLTFCGGHRLVLHETEEDEIEVINRKETPDKFQLEFLQGMLKRPTATTIENVKSVAEGMINKIEIEETTSRPKIGRREGGTFVITEPASNNETHADKVDSLPQKTIEHQKKASNQKTISSQKLNTSANQIDGNRTVEIEKRGKENIIKKVEIFKDEPQQIEVKKNNVDGKEHVSAETNVEPQRTMRTGGKTKNLIYKSGTTSKSLKNLNGRKAAVVDITINGDNLKEKNETFNVNKARQSEIQKESLSKKEAVCSEEHSENKNNQQTKIKKRTSISTLEKNTSIIRENDKIDEINGFKEKRKNETLKGGKPQKMRDKSDSVNTKDKVGGENKKIMEKAESKKIEINTVGSELKTTVNAIRRKVGVMDETKDNKIRDKNESLRGGKKEQIIEKIKRPGKNETAIVEAQSGTKKICNAEEKSLLPTSTSEIEPYAIKNVINRNAEAIDEAHDSIKKLESTVEEYIPKKIDKVGNESKSDEIFKFAENSFENIGDLNSTTEKIGSEVHKGIIKELCLPEEEKKETLVSSENIVLKRIDTPEIVRDTQDFIRKTDINVESCSTDVEKKGNSSDNPSANFGVITSHSKEILCGSTTKVSLGEHSKTDENSEKIDGNDNCSQHHEQHELECKEKGKEAVDNLNDADNSVKETEKETRDSVVKSASQNDKIRSDILKKSASENVIIIKAAKKDSEETVESVLGITKPFLEQIQSKMLNFVTKNSKSKAKIRNFSFRSHAVKKCKEISALLKKSQENLLDDNSVGLVKICQHAKMMNRFSRTKLPPKRLNGNTPKTATALLIAAADKSKQSQGKKAKKKGLASEGLVQSAIENKVTSKMKSLSKTPNDGNRLATVRTSKRYAKSQEKKDEFTPSASISDLGKDSIGSIFAEVVASALVKCGKVDGGVSSRPDSQKQFTKIMDMAQDVKQKIKQVEICADEVTIEELVIRDEINDSNDFMIEGGGLRKLGLNVKFMENKKGASDRFKCNLALVLNNKENDENFRENTTLLTSEPCGISKCSEAFQQIEKKTNDLLSMFTNEARKQSQELLFKVRNEENIPFSMIDHQVNISHEVHVSSLDNNAFSERVTIPLSDEGNNNRTDETKLYQNPKSSTGRELEINETLTNKENTSYRGRITPISEKTNRDEQKGILTVEDEIKRLSFEFLHTQSNDVAAKLKFDKISDSRERRDEESDLHQQVTIIKNNEEVVITVPNPGRTIEDINSSGGLIEQLDIGELRKNERGRDGSTVPVPDHLVRFGRVHIENEGGSCPVSVPDSSVEFNNGQIEKKGDVSSVSSPDQPVRFSKKQNEDISDKLTVVDPDHQGRLSKGQIEKEGDGSKISSPDHLVRLSKGEIEKEDYRPTFSVPGPSVRLSKEQNKKEGDTVTDPLVRLSKGKIEKEGHGSTFSAQGPSVRLSKEQNKNPDPLVRISKGQIDMKSHGSTFSVPDPSVRFSKANIEREGHRSTVSVPASSVRFSKGHIEKEGDLSTVSIPDHSVRLNKGKNRSLSSNAKLKPSVGWKPERENVEIGGKIEGFQGLNRQNRNSAMKYLSYSDEYTKNTLDIFPEVFLTPFSSKTDLAKELDVYKGDLEENFGIIKDIPNLSQAASGMSKMIHIATTENQINAVKPSAYVNDIRSSCNVNDFPNSKICRENDRSNKDSRNYEYLKRRIEQDKLANDAKCGISKEELKAKKKSVGNFPELKKYNEMSENLKEAFAGLEKMGNSIKQKTGNSIKQKMGNVVKEKPGNTVKEKTTKRENIPEKSSIKSHVSDYLRHQKRDFATKNLFIYNSDSERLFSGNSTLDTKAQLGQTKTEIPEGSKKGVIEKPSGLDQPSNRNGPRENSIYHEMVRRSELNNNKKENIKENDEFSHKPTFYFFNAEEESFDEVSVVSRVFSDTKPSMTKYTEIITADEKNPIIDMSQVKVASSSNNGEKSRRTLSENMDEIKNIDSKQSIADKFFQNSTNEDPKPTSTDGPIDNSAENYKTEKSSDGNNSDQLRYLKIGAPEEKIIKMINSKSFLEKEEMRPLDLRMKAVQYEPLVMEDLKIRIDEDELTYKPKSSHIPIRSSEVTPKNKILEKFALIGQEPGSSIYKIRRDLKFNPSTKRVCKNAVSSHDPPKSRVHVAKTKSKGLSSQETAAKKPTNLKHEHTKPKSKKMIIKLTPSKELYSPPKTSHDDLKRTLLKNPSKLLEIAGEIMDKNQYLNFLLDLKSKREIRSIWWKKIYDGIFASLRLAESITSKVRKAGKVVNIETKRSTKVKSPMSIDLMKSKRSVKAVKRESLNFEQIFRGSRRDKKKETVVVVKERTVGQSSVKPVSARSVKVRPYSEEKPKKGSRETETDIVKSKSANLKSPRGNQMLKNDNTKDGTNRRHLSSQYRESTNFKSNSLPYTLKKFLETPDSIPKTPTTKTIENFQNIFVLGEEIKVPKLKNALACHEIPNELRKLINTEGGDGIGLLRDSQTDNNSKDAAACRELPRKSSKLPLKTEVDNHGNHSQKDCETMRILGEELSNETQVLVEQDAKPIAEDKKDEEKSESEQTDRSIQERYCGALETIGNEKGEQPLANIVFAEAQESEKEISFILPENLNEEEGLTEIADKDDIYVELNNEPVIEESELATPIPRDQTEALDQSNLNGIASKTSDIPLDKDEVNVLRKATTGSIGSSLRDTSELDNSSDFLSFPRSSVCSEDEECKIKMMKATELDHSSDVNSNRSGPVSSECSEVKTRKNSATRAALGRCGKGEILKRNALFDDMCKSTEKLMIGAKQMGQMNFQTRRKFENPLSKFVPKKEISTNVEIPGESITDTSARADDDSPKVRVVRTKSFSEVLKDDPSLLMRLREQKKLPSYVTPRRTEEVPRKFEYRYHDFRRKCDVGGKAFGKSQSRKKDFFEKFRDLMQTKKPINENDQPILEDGSEQTKPKMISKILGKMKCFEDEEVLDAETADKKDGAATDRNPNTRRNFCNSLLLKSKFGSWRFVHTKMEHIDEDELMTWVQEHPGTPESRSRSDNTKEDGAEKQNVIHVPWISSRANAEEDN